MGLAVSVGFLADLKVHDEEGYTWARETFEKVYALLESKGFETWKEPEDFPRLVLRQHIGSFPYSFLHYLRRAYAYTVEYPNQTLFPTEEGLTDEDERVVDDASSMLNSHLLCHSDSAGLYVPVRFRDPLFDLDNIGIPGEMLGSSYALLDELRTVAPAIGIDLLEGELSDAEAERIFRVGCDDADPWTREYVVFLALWEAAKASITYNTAIVFN